MIRLVPSSPFAFSPALRFLKLSPALSGSTIVQADSVLHTARIRGRTIALSVCSEQTASSEPETLRCEAALEAGTSETNSAVSAYLDNYLSLSVDLTGFYAIAEKDKRFAAEVMPKLRGYHPVKFPTPLESIVWAVLSQATPQTIARKLMQNVAAIYGDQVALGEVTLTAFPDAQTLIDTPKGALRDLIANERKAKTIQAAAQSLLAADPIWLETAPTEFLEAWLREIPGIGAWSSALILVRGFGRMDALTADSLAGAAGEAFLTAAKRVYGPPVYRHSSCGGAGKIRSLRRILATLSSRRFSALSPPIATLAGSPLFPWRG